MPIARDRHQTLSRTVASLLRGALADAPRASTLKIDEATGLPTVHVGDPVTAEDVATANDDA